MLVFWGGVEIETLSFHVDARLICVNPGPHLGTWYLLLDHIFCCIVLAGFAIMLVLQELFVSLLNIEIFHGQYLPLHSFAGLFLPKAFLKILSVHVTLLAARS